MSLVDHLLVSALDVYRRTRVSDGQGGYGFTYSLLETGRPVKVDQASARERAEAEQAGASMTHKIYQSNEADVQRGDEFRQQGSEKVYRVNNVVEPSHAGVYRRADVELIQPEGRAV